MREVKSYVGAKRASAGAGHYDYLHCISQGKSDIGKAVTVEVTDGHLWYSARILQNWPRLNSSTGAEEYKGPAYPSYESGPSYDDVRKRVLIDKAHLNIAKARDSPKRFVSTRCPVPSPLNIFDPAAFNTACGCHHIQESVHIEIGYLDVS